MLWTFGRHAYTCYYSDSILIITKAHISLVDHRLRKIGLV